MSSLLHHLPSWERLRSILTSRFSLSWSSNRGKSSDSEPSCSKRKKAEYKDLEVSNPTFRDRSYEMAPVKSIRTYIHTGNPSEVEEDGIHLQYKVEQESTTNEPGGQQSLKGWNPK